MPGTPAPPSSRSPIRPSTALKGPAVTTGRNWNPDLMEYLLDWDDVRIAPDPHRTALEFGVSVIRHACTVCNWDPVLAASAQGIPPPVT